MQTVPSLVGIGTAVGAAATGLVFGQALDLDPSFALQPPSNSGAVIPSDNDRTALRPPRLSSQAPPSRPATSSASASQAPAPIDESRYPPISGHFGASSTSRQPRPLSTQFTPPKTSSRRHSFIRQGDFGSTLGVEDVRDSVSSHGSWMRRLSIRPLSQHGSPRSSVGPDSPSVTFSHGSAAPILSPTASVPSQLPPNKLVKRASNSFHASSGTVTRRRSRSHLPTLRRPATSHQRSATLQQFQQAPDVALPPSVHKYSLDQHTRPTEILSPQLPPQDTTSRQRSGIAWASFFHSRASRGQPRASSSRGLEGSPNNRALLPARRICVNEREKTAAYLIHSSMVNSDPVRTDILGPVEAPVLPEMTISPQGEAEPSPSPEATPSKRARRSISMHFPSPTSWISKTGSIRRPKRGQESKAGGKRHVSAPADGAQHATNDEYDPTAEEILTLAQRSGSDGDPATLLQTKNRKRNSSSPLPPLSRLSSFNVDLNKLGSSLNSQPARQNQPSGSSQGSSTFTHRNLPNERSSTMNSSDFDSRDFMSADDDDTDFKSDTMFDSIRTVASGRMRTVETPLESMFDESPPSTAGNTKTKRLSIQEILGSSWHGEDRIMEEDEGIPTPVRDAHESIEVFATRHAVSNRRFEIGPPSHDLSLATRDFGRLSLDDDLDDDWAKDEETPLSNHLSPPNSVNSRAISPSLRMALADASGKSSPESRHREIAGERPLSNLFDWSEPSIHDKQDAEGQSPRPKTVHGKQEMDVRGGRSAIRKGPTAAHVRSQSVPVVHDTPEISKASTTKFGTWGLGTKPAAEEWDDDFEFPSADFSNKEGKTAEKTFAMVVPASIQASQPSVKAHSGQLREFSLLVNDLKRLCRHGKDMDMLDGPHASLWKEAEGIIALASPDEDTLDGADAGTAADGASIVNDHFQDDDFDAESLDKGADPFEAQDLAVPKSHGRDRTPGRRRSVFSPDDDIFGGSWPTADESAQPSRPKTPETSITLPSGQDINTVVRSMVEAMQSRSASDPSPLIHGSGTRLHFGSSSLKALVKRAGDLRDALSELVRRADPIAPSPARTPRRHDNDSPAFTRVFTDPSSSPPRRLPHSRSKNSVLNASSMDTSPSNGISQRMIMTTVS